MRDERVPKNCEVLNVDDHIIEEGIREEDILVLRRIKRIAPPDREELSCLGAAKNRADFMMNIGIVEGDGNIALPHNDETSRPRPKIALLYTDEDVHVASYVRTHFDALDKASGNDCDMFFIENLNSITSHRYWYSVLDRLAYVIWRSGCGGRESGFDGYGVCGLWHAAGNGGLCGISGLRCAVVPGDGGAAGGRLSHGLAGR